MTPAAPANRTFSLFDREVFKGTSRAGFLINSKGEGRGPAAVLSCPSETLS